MKLPLYQKTDGTYTKKKCHLENIVEHSKLKYVPQKSHELSQNVSFIFSKVRASHRTHPKYEILLQRAFINYRYTKFWQTGNQNSGIKFEAL